MTETNRIKELHTVRNIAKNNGYNKQQVIKLCVGGWGVKRYPE
jgi:hypothetical protein